MIREGDKSMEKLKKLMNSYVPEFAYEPGASDPGSVLTDLCAEMIGTCEERYSRVLSKHRIQYLNLFDRFRNRSVHPEVMYSFSR